MRFSKKLKRLARRENAVATQDPEGVMATLQIAKRLLTEGSPSIAHALDEAIAKAAPKDPERAWWAAYRVIARHTPPDPFADRSEMVEAASRAIKAQGTVNAYAAKGIRP